MTSALPPLPPGWTEHTAPTGHKYYYHAATKKSTYKRPLPQPPEETPPVAPEPQEPKPTAKEPTPKQEEDIVQITEWSNEYQEPHRAESPERQTARIMGEENWKKLQDRPRKKTEVPGAEPWVQVTTKWRRFFYHNPETGESYWKIPEGIRPVVERWLIETARETVEEEESEEESEEEYPEDEEQQEAGMEFTEEDIAYQLAMMQSEYGQEDVVMMEPEDELDPAAKRQIFISLLEEKDVNPFNTWENEVPKIVHDPRYSMLKNTKERMEIFAEWARARITLIKEEKEREVKEDPKVGYLRYLTEKADPKEYWFEFKRKHRKAPEYKHYGSEKSREDVWRDWVARKKLSREKREADLLSWMRGLKGSREEILAKVQADVRYWVVGDDKNDLVNDALRAR